MSLAPPPRDAAHLALHDLLCRFQAAFDHHDWDALSDCLADPLHTDYSSFRGTPAATVARDEYVGLRRAALSDLRMQHNFSNLRIETAAGRTRGFCNYAIYRFAAAGPAGFHSFGRYVFDFTHDGDAWRISGITQFLLENMGDAAIHAGAATR